MGKRWRLEADGDKASVLVLASIPLHMILLVDNCTGNTNLQALSRDVGHQVPFGLVHDTNHLSYYVLGIGKSSLKREATDVTNSTFLTQLPVLMSQAILCFSFFSSW